jgi:hypothetical protein
MPSRNWLSSLRTPKQRWLAMRTNARPCAVWQTPPVTLSRYGGHERALVALTVVCNAAVAVAITFMVLTPVKKVLTRRVGRQGLTAYQRDAGTYLNRRANEVTRRLSIDDYRVISGRSVFRRAGRALDPRTLPVGHGPNSVARNNSGRSLTSKNRIVASPVDSPNRLLVDAPIAV